MELTSEQQAEYDELHKELVAQGGPTKGRLKAAGIRNPGGVARLIELGWVNPDAVEVGKSCGDCRNDEPKCQLRGPFDASCDDFNPKPPIDPEETELEKAEKEAEEAKEAASEAVRIAQEKAEIVESKQPAPCWRCGGDGTWHSTKTGIRAKTSSEPLCDSSRVCPECN